MFRLPLIMPKRPRRAAPPPIAVFFISAAVLIAGLFWLTSLLRRPPPAEGARRVAATIFPIYDIVRNVGRDVVSVDLILPPGAEPHSFEPRPSLIASLRGAAAVYAVGHGLDVWIDQVVSAAGTAEVVVDRAIAIRPSVVPFTDAAAAAASEGPDDPHYWLTIPNAELIAGTVADDLAARFPDQAARIRLNLNSYLAELDAADRTIRRDFAGLKSRSFISFHDAWYYFAAAYGLHLAGTFEPTAGREPTPRYLTTLRDVIRQDGVTVLYFEPQFNVDLMSAFARDNNVKLAVLDDIGGTPGRDSYIKLMLSNAQTIEANQ